MRKSLLLYGCLVVLATPVAFNAVHAKAAVTGSTSTNATGSMNSASTSTSGTGGYNSPNAVGNQSNGWRHQRTNVNAPSANTYYQGTGTTGYQNDVGAAGAGSMNNTNIGSSNPNPPPQQ